MSTARRPRFLTAEQAAAKTRPIRKGKRAQPPEPTAFLAEAIAGSCLVATNARDYVRRSPEGVTPALVRYVRDLDRRAALLRDAVDAVVRERREKTKCLKRP